jgi:hypothetical protein
MTWNNTRKTSRRNSKPLSDKQQEALKIGQRIRSLLCMLAQGRIAGVTWEHQQKLNDIVDAELHRMGYESYREHRARINALQMQEAYTKNMTEKELDKFYKFQRLPQNG